MPLTATPCPLPLASRHRSSPPSLTPNPHPLPCLLPRQSLLASPHRTLDGASADFYYVPVYMSCAILPVYDWSGSPSYQSGFPMRPVTAMRMARALLCLPTAPTYCAYLLRLLYLLHSPAHPLHPLCLLHLLYSLHSPAPLLHPLHPLHPLDPLCPSGARGDGACAQHAALLERLQGSAW